MRKAILAKPVVFLPPVEQFKGMDDSIRAESGTEVLVLDRTSGDAVQVMYKGRTNWVHESYLIGSEVNENSRGRGNFRR